MTYVRQVYVVEAEVVRELGRRARELGVRVVEVQVVRELGGATLHVVHEAAARALDLAPG